MARIFLYLVALFLTASSSALAAQVPTIGLQPSPATSQTGERSVAANNPWYAAGAQLGFKFDGNNDFSDDLVASARTVIRTLRFKGQSQRVGIPLIGNISKLTAGTPKDSIKPTLDKIINSAEGVNIGLYPYFETIDRSGANPGQVQFTVYGSAAWKLNMGRSVTDSSAVAINQGRFSMGFGLDLYIAEGTQMPLSISVEPVLTLASRSALSKVSKSTDIDTRIVSVEFTGIIPLNGPFALIGQTAIPERGTAPFRVGLLFMNSAPPSPPKPPQTGPAAPASTMVGATLVGTVTTAAGTPASKAAVLVTAYLPASGQQPVVDNKCTGTEAATQRATAQEDGKYRVNVLAGTVPFEGCVSVEAEKDDRKAQAVKAVSFKAVRQVSDLTETTIDFKLP